MDEPTFAAFAAAAGERACFRHLDVGRSDVAAANGALTEMLFWWRALDECQPAAMASGMRDVGVLDARHGLIWARNVAAHRAVAVGRRRVDGGMIRAIPSSIRADVYVAWLPWSELPAPRAKPEFAAVQVASYRDNLSDARTEDVVRRLSLVFGRF